MAMPDQLVDAFNDQIALELASANAYLQMSADLAARSLPGMARWMRLQAEEERAHALRFLDFLIEREAPVRLQALPAPPVGLQSVVAVFEAALEQERSVTGAIHRLYALAQETSDFASVPLLQWFITEQVEEEAAVSQIIDDLRLIGDDGAALLLLDRELGARPEPGAEA